jgi:hypothetical protein
MNYCNEKDEIYCCLRNKVVKLDQLQLERFCQSCKMFGGTLQGGGVVCIWDDSRDVSNPHDVYDPQEEFLHNQVKQVPPEGPAMLDIAVKPALF